MGLLWDRHQILLWLPIYLVVFCWAEMIYPSYICLLRRQRTLSDWRVRPIGVNWWPFVVGYGSVEVVDGIDGTVKGFGRTTHCLKLRRWRSFSFCLIISHIQTWIVIIIIFHILLIFFSIFVWHSHLRIFQLSFFNIIIRICYIPTNIFWYILQFPSQVVFVRWQSSSSIGLRIGWGYSPEILLFYIH